MRAIVEGLRSNGKREFIFYKECHTLNKIQEAVELAFDKGATLVIIRRIISKKGV